MTLTTITPRAAASIALTIGRAREIANDAGRRVRVVRELRIAANTIAPYDHDLAVDIRLMILRSPEATARELVNDTISLFFDSLS